MARKMNKREQRTPKIRIVGAGITEFWYMKHLKSLCGFNYELQPRVFGNESMNAINRFIDEAISEQQPVICLFDNDVAQWNQAEAQRMRQLHQTYDGNPDVLLCDSMPSIEYWFLLHYEHTNRYLGTSAATVQALRKYQPKFDKAHQFLQNPRWVFEMSSEGRLQIALQRAEQFPPDSPSYTRMPLAIRRLQEEKEKSQKSQKR